jgi:hypothetical protein
MKPSSERSSERLIRKKKRVADVQAQDEVEVDDGDELPVRKKKKKRPVEVEYDEPVEEKKVKKKKKVNVTELKSKAVALRTDVAIEAQNIEQEIAERKEQQLTDNTWMTTYEVMFKKLRRIMRNVENKVLNSDSGSNDIYALMALYNQMREVIADIRSMMDLTQNTQRIIDQVLYPLIRDISNNYVDAIFLINKNLRANVDSNKYIEMKAATDECLKEHAKYIQAAYEKSSEKLAQLLEE